MKRLLSLVLPIIFAACPAMAAEPALIAVPRFTLWTIEQPVRITGHEYDTFAPVGHTRYRTVEVDIEEEFLKEIELPVLTDIFIRKLVGSAKFTVMERSRADVLLDEIEGKNDGSVDGSALLNRGRMLGARYIAIGTLTYAARDVERESVAYTSRTDLVERGEIRVDLRILEVATGRIAASVPGKGKIERRIREGAAEPRPLPGSLFADLREELAHDLMTRAVDALYPFKVVSVKEGTVVADRGENFRIKNGEVFDVIRQGAPIVDPDTGNVIAFDEEVLDRVRVTQILEKACRAEIVTGSTRIRPGDILRPAGTASP
jgi:hypothetical protein